MENIDNFKMRMKLYCEMTNRDMKKNGVRIIGEPIAEANFDMSVLAMNIRMGCVPDGKFFRVIVTDNKYVGLIDKQDSVPQSTITNMNDSMDDIDNILVLLGVKILDSRNLQIHLKRRNGFTVKKHYTLKDGYLLPDVDGYVQTNKDYKEVNEQQLSEMFDMSTPNTDAFQKWNDNYVRENKKTLLDLNGFNHDKKE